MIVPSFVRHYYLEGKQPFLNIMDLDLEQRNEVAKELNLRHEKGMMHLAYPDWYFKQRIEAENNLSLAAKEKGIDVKRSSPHYFSLGESEGFDWVYKGDYLFMDFKLDPYLKKHMLFSIGDTLWTFASSYLDGQLWENKWFQGKLYYYDELQVIFNQIGVSVFSKEFWKEHQTFVVEGMIWDDEVLDIILN